MTIHLFAPEPADQVPELALTTLRHHAQLTPLKIAWRHRRHGVWNAWRWADVLQDVERCAAALRELGFTGQAPVALCGALEPALLTFALAVRSLGARCVVVSRDSQGEALEQALKQARPGFAFVQRREEVAHWRQASDAQNLPLTVVTSDAAAGKASAWQVVPMATLLAGERPAAQPLAWRQVAADEVVWVDEGTEWAEGLKHLLSRWLDTGTGFAFPETRGSASRDRRELAPTVLLLSAPRAQSLADEIEARLAPPGSWRRRLCDWTLLDPRRGVRRWIKARVRTLLGFQRLAHIDCPVPASTTAQPRATARLAWLHHGPVERAA